MNDDVANTADTTANKTDETLALAGRYGQIGISAVAAAAQYQGIAKNPAYAPVQTKWHEYTGEAAA